MRDIGIWESTVDKSARRDVRNTLAYSWNQGVAGVELSRIGFFMESLQRLMEKYSCYIISTNLPIRVSLGIFPKTNLCKLQGPSGNPSPTISNY
jgi:hypothetical protein